MKVTLTHDGKSVELDLTAEQMTALGLKEEKKKTGYEREKRHYIVGTYDTIIQSTGLDRDCYDRANYYSDSKLASDNARADRLMRRLRRFAAENGGIPSVKDWNTLERKYFINYRYPTMGSLNCGLCIEADIFVRRLGNVYFYTSEAAAKALAEFHDELIWYFTEYEAMLR